jgi:hypothetical protein
MLEDAPAIKAVELLFLLSCLAYACSATTARTAVGSTDFCRYVELLISSIGISDMATPSMRMLPVAT